MVGEKSEDQALFCKHNNGEEVEYFGARDFYTLPVKLLVGALTIRQSGKQYKDGTAHFNIIVEIPPRRVAKRGVTFTIARIRGHREDAEKYVERLICSTQEASVLFQNGGAA